jgi:hypothetical protein
MKGGMREGCAKHGEVWSCHRSSAALPRPRYSNGRTWFERHCMGMLRVWAGLEWPGIHSVLYVLGIAVHQMACQSHTDNEL